MAVVGLPTTPSVTLIPMLAAPAAAAVKVAPANGGIDGSCCAGELDAGVTLSASVRLSMLPLLAVSVTVRGHSGAVGIETHGKVGQRSGLAKGYRLAAVPGTPPMVGAAQ